MNAAIPPTRNDNLGENKDVKITIIKSNTNIPKNILLFLGEY